MFTNFALRVGVFAWGHPFYTAFTGLGFAVARTNRNILVKFVAPLIGYFLAVLAHSFHNTSLVFVSGLGSLALVILLEWAGWLIFLGFIIWLIRHEQGLLKKHLREEVGSGLISEAQYKTAVSFFQFGARMAALSGGSYKATSHFYQYLGELAHKKEQLEKFGLRADLLARRDQQARRHRHGPHRRRRIGVGVRRQAGIGTARQTRRSELHLRRAR